VGFRYSGKKTNQEKIMKLNHLSNFFIAVCLLLGTFASLPVQTAQASALGTQATSPDSYLNGDGSLRLDGSFSGSFDLDGWNVELDPALGPVFSPVAYEDNWSAVGGSANPVGGYVNSVYINGADVYIGGAFKNVAGIDEADYIARWDGANWHALGGDGSGNGALTSQVHDITLANGILYVAGYFAVKNNGMFLPGAANLAKWDGSNWSAVDGGISAAITNSAYSLAISEINSHSYLYVGGGFTNAAGIPEADYIARLDLDTNTWSALGNNGAGNGSLNSFVSAIAIDSNGYLYAGGFFTDVNNYGAPLLEADRIARWDGANWSALGNNGVGVGALNNPVRGLAVDGSDNIYAVGDFYNVAGIAAAAYVAKWNGSSWSALGSNGMGGAALAYLYTDGLNVRTVLINGTDIYVGGSFTMAGNGTGDFIAKFDTLTNTWSGLGSNGAGDGSLNGPVNDLAYSAGNLFVGGNFHDINNSGSKLGNANNFAKYNNISGWSGFAGSSASMNNLVTAIAVDGTDVYVGGAFENLNGRNDLSRIAKWDGTQWQPLADGVYFGSAISGGGVEAITIAGDDVYVGGYFSFVQNNGADIYTAGRIAKWNKVTKTWSALGSNGSGGSAIANGYVYDIAVNGTDVYVGGSFTNVANIAAADYIARFDGANWFAVDSNGSGNGSLNNTVFALTIGFGDDLFVGGAFTNVNNHGFVLDAADYIAKWDGADWSALSGPSAALNNDVFALAVAGNDLYVGGRFLDVNGMSSADYIAKFTPMTATWASLGDYGTLSALTDWVRDIAVNGSEIYVGGDFKNVYDNGLIPEADFVVRWDGSHWSALGGNGAGNGSLPQRVYALAISDHDLVVGGDFMNVNNNGTLLKDADYLAAFGLPGSSDITPPVTMSSSRANTNPSSAVSVDFDVVFSESVTGVDASDFVLTKAGVSGAVITNVSGSGASYAVTVNTGSGNGTIRLDVVDNDSIKDGSNNPLGGAGVGNGSFTSGEEYTIVKNLASGWVGGVSITSDKKVVAVGRPHIGNEVTSYDGFAGGTLTAYVPMLFKDAFGGSYDSALYIQNVDVNYTAHITVKYYDSNGNLNCTKADTLAAGASKGYWLPSATCDSGSLPAGWVGGVVVTSDRLIVAVGRPHIGSEVMTYDGFGSGFPVSYIPMLFKGAFGGSYNAAFYVQNVNESNTANITIEYYDNAGNLNCTKADTIAPLASKGYWVPTTTCDTGSLPAGWVGGVVVTSDQWIVGVGRVHIGNQITTYNGFSYGHPTSYTPMLFNSAFGGSYNTAFYVQNTDRDNTTNVTIKYYDNAGNLNCTRADTIAPLASKGYWLPSITCDSGSLPVGWTGGVVVESDQQIVTVARAHIGQQVTTYNGFMTGNWDSYIPMLFSGAFGGSYNAAFYVQNTEDSTATVTLKFYDSNGNLSCVRTDSIPALSIFGYWAPSVNCDL